MCKLPSYQTRPVQLMGQHVLRYGGSPYVRSMGRVCRTSSEKVVTSLFLMFVKQNRGLKLTKSRVSPASYNLSDKIGGKFNKRL